MHTALASPSGRGTSRRESQGHGEHRWPEGEPRVRWVSVGGALNSNLIGASGLLLEKNNYEIVSVKASFLYDWCKEQNNAYKVVF